MAHKLSYQDYLAQYGDPELPTAKWQCLMCGSETRHARNNIYIHLRDCHSMTCDQYAAQHGMPGMERTEDGSFSWPGPGDQVTSGAHHVVIAQEQGATGVVSTQFSSKWNKCKFQCPVCDKISNEKRHIRTHTMSAHGMSLDVLEAENGDCEFHTEYFFCAVCHAEVKHCHRNILMHLQRSHNLTCAEYEACALCIYMIPMLQIPVSDTLLVCTEYIFSDRYNMTSNQLVKVFGSEDAKHLIFGNSLIKNWKGVKDGTDIGDGLDYAVFAHSGANLHQLLTDVAATLSALPEEDKAGRTCIVQVIIKTFY